MRNWNVDTDRDITFRLWIELSFDYFLLFHSVKTTKAMIIELTGHFIIFGLFYESFRNVKKNCLKSSVGEEQLFFIGTIL